ncbi:Abi family protein [Staphylococcus xylosus]|uniref:Abi family protein n=1 Tax=Staphylococcus xylosus TaxID=1288 RepID=UPI002DB836D9|nr:Abi family protein [Staphylococcus xylosus]MEB8100150.1 Abi family protein [Staphylococcus xylosus]
MEEILLCTFIKDLKRFKPKPHFLKPAKEHEIKDFKNIDQLINKLEFSKEKPLTFTEEEKLVAKTFFRTVNFYTFSIYRKLLIGKESYNFSECLSLYNFDVFLRENLMKFTGYIELFVKTSFIYNICSVYQGKLEKADCFLDESLYINRSRYESILYMLEERVSKSRTAFMNHHKNKKSYKIPIWVMMEDLTFGEATFFIESIVPEIKNEWLNYLVENENLDINLEKNYKKSIFSWIESTRFIRNTCAHHSRIYGSLLNVNSPKYSTVDMRKLKNEGLKKGDNFTLFARLLAIKNLLVLHSDRAKIEWNEFLDEFERLIKGNVLIHENYMGLINNWKNYLSI